MANFRGFIASKSFRSMKPSYALKMSLYFAAHFDVPKIYETSKETL